MGRLSLFSGILKRTHSQLPLFVMTSYGHGVISAMAVPCVVQEASVTKVSFPDLSTPMETSNGTYMLPMYYCAHVSERNLSMMIIHCSHIIYQIM